MTAERDQQAERDHAEFAGWFEAQDYTTGAFESDSMAEAFTAGMQAARDLGDWFEVGDADAGTLPAAPRPAPERDKLRDALEDIARAAQGSIDASLPPDYDWFVSRALEGLGWLPEGWPKAPQPAPELGTAWRLLDEARAERDKAYGERADLVAYLAACYPSVIEDDLSDWPVVFVSTPSGQLSWHIARSDLGAFRHVPRATSVAWDGHTTPEKYQRLAELTRTVATGLYGPQP